MRVLKFSADWCGPCKQMSAWLITHEHNHNIVELDAAYNRESFEYYGIRSVPTLIMLDDSGATTKTLTGFDKDRLSKFLES